MYVRSDLCSLMRTFGATLLCCTLLAQGLCATETTQRDIIKPVAEQRQDGSVGGALNGEAVNLGRYHALLIGINAYQNPGFAPTLSTPVNDVRVMRQLLEKEYGFSDVTVLRDSEATRSGILRAMAKLRESNLTESDNVLLYYAGHGSQERDTKEGFWIPVDATPDVSTWV